jgi:DNA-directed RNA polymerase specialized sigma24 family protein
VDKVQIDQTSEAVLQAAVEYAKNGDEGAMRFLSQRFPGVDAAAVRDHRRTMPFSAWRRRVRANAAVADGAGTPTGPSDLAHLRPALRNLPPNERQVLVLHYFGGLSFGAIASLTGRPERVVASLYEEGRDSLRAVLSRPG